MNLGTENRGQMYRSAGRTPRFQVYVAMEAAWGLVALYVIAKDLFIAPGDASPVALALLVCLSLAHSMKMAFVQPWQILKATLAGALIFVAAVGFPIFPARRSIRSLSLL